MRALFFILILVVAAAIVAIATGFLDITQTRGAKAPDVRTDNGVVAAGGQAPAFDIETGSVAVGTTQRNVVVPTVKVVPPNQQSIEQSNQVANTSN